MSYYMYENWTAEGHKARLHVGDCSFCKNGMGIHPDAGERNGKWHGPFTEYDQAMQAAQATGGNVSNCQRCLPLSHARHPPSQP